MELVERKRLSPAALAAGAVVVLVLVAGAYLLLRYTQRAGPAAEALPFDQTEQGYAQRIHFRNLQMSRAANFLNQQVTFLSGQIENAGTRDIRDMEVTVEYHDAFNQVVLRESYRPLGAPRPMPIPAGQTRSFQLTFEHIPDLWNHEYPSIHVTGLALE